MYIIIQPLAYERQNILKKLKTIKTPKTRLELEIRAENILKEIKKYFKKGIDI